MRTTGLLFVLFLMTAGIYADEHEDVIARRQAFRRDVEAHPEKTTQYLASPDAEVRRYALYLTVQTQGAGAKEVCKACMKDPDEQVRLTALEALLYHCRTDPDVQKLFAETASTDTSRKIAKLASDASWPFHREAVLIRNNPFWDHEVKTLRKDPIPDTEWIFKTDPSAIGHLPNQTWYREKIDEKGWRPIRHGYWERQGYNYDGVAWYRIRFTMPQKMECNAVELAFGAVDESAWVWLNGVYLGSHDIGPDGWNTTFALDCTKEVRWGEENVLVVRVLDTEQAGGIWKPIHVEILK